MVSEENKCINYDKKGKAVMSTELDRILRDNCEIKVEAFAILLP